MGHSVLGKISEYSMSLKLLCSEQYFSQPPSPAGTWCLSLSSAQLTCSMLLSGSNRLSMFLLIFISFHTSCFSWEQPSYLFIRLEIEEVSTKSQRQAHLSIMTRDLNLTLIFQLITQGYISIILFLITR